MCADGTARVASAIAHIRHSLTPINESSMKFTHRSGPFVLAFAVAASKVSAQYDAPTTYYSTITTQTGTALQSQLASIMTAGHIQTSYADARDYLPFTDANPDNLTQMFEFYTHATIQKPSASHVGFVGIYESREHVWPDSLQGPGDTSNSSRGSRGDIHMLKPLDQSVNSSRGNNPYGGATTTGAARNISGGYWFPGTTDKGDAARILFYAATRYQSTLSLVSGLPTSNTQMGDLAALLRFHYQDTPDLFELRRNDTIYRGDDVRTVGDDSAFAGTKNRNAYIDRPEYVWSVFADQQNDTRLSIGTADANGGSSATVDLGRVLRNAPVPVSSPLTLNKAGVDGTYYEVRTEGAATSTITGRYNAFAMDAAGSRSLGVGLSTSTAVAGLKSGRVIVNNLDVTTAGGQGRGANDADDAVDVKLSVLSPSNPSFAADGDVDAMTVDFDVLAVGSDVQTIPFAINNLASALGVSLTAKLDIDLVTKTGATSVLTANASTLTNLPAGLSYAFTSAFHTDTLGTFASDYLLSTSDENLPGTVTTSQLSLHLIGSVATAGDVNLDLTVNFDDLIVLAQHYGASDGLKWREGDFTHDGIVNFDDLILLAQNYNGLNALGSDAFASDWTLAQALVPEPTLLTSGVLLAIAFSSLARRIRHPV